MPLSVLFSEIMVGLQVVDVHHDIENILHKRGIQFAMFCMLGKYVWSKSLPILNFETNQDNQCSSIVQKIPNLHI